MLTLTDTNDDKKQLMVTHLKMKLTVTQTMTNTTDDDTDIPDNDTAGSCCIGGDCLWVVLGAVVEGGKLTDIQVNMKGRDTSL